MDKETCCQTLQSEPVPLFPGITLYYVNFTEAPPAVRHEPLEHILQINYCKSGQLVWKMGNGTQIFLNPGNFSLHTMSACADSALLLPNGSYEGLTICVDLQEAAAHPPELIAETGFFSDLLGEKFCRRSAAAFLAGNEHTESVFSGFYGQPEKLRLPIQRVKALELFLYLAGTEFAPQSQLTEYQSEQIETVREIHDWLLLHMAQRITIEELSRQFMMNPTTLKAAFKSVYGASLAAHIREHRMEQAAKLLRDTDKSVAEVAQAVGYDSQSKFTAAFKAAFQVLPREYRKNAK